MNNPNVEKARELLERCGTMQLWSKYAEALDAAGLLVTPLRERALEACKRAAECHKSWSLSPDGAEDGVVAACVRIGREAIDAEKPKNRWARHGTDVLRDGRWHATFGTETDALAYAAQKNAEDAK